MNIKDEIIIPIYDCVLSTMLIIVGVPLGRPKLNCKNHF